MNLLQKCASAAVFSLVCLVITGCDGAVQVVVPPAFHGRLLVHCTSVGSNDAAMRADVNGVADGPCPSFKTGVSIVRGGRHVSVLRTPSWTSTRDGIPTAIHIEVD